jgi:glucose-6-phosphate isomerase
MLVARYHLDPINDQVEAAVFDLVERRATERLWDRDHTLFQDDPADCANRMGWLDTFRRSHSLWPELRDAADAIAPTCDQVVLMGMGGSSLFPEVLGRTFGPAPGHPTLVVLDTTHPDAVQRVIDTCAPDRTFYLASSKSGSTVETRSHLDLFWARSGDPERFGVITDPGSPLGSLARDRGYRHVWENDPDIGGRYSALSLFGMVPAALLGLDGEALLDGAEEAAEMLAPLGDDGDHNVGLRLGAAIGAAAQSGRDHLTLVLDPRIASFGNWLEQLVAESLGKHGIGVVPVVGEPSDVIAATPDDRLVVVIGDVELPTIDGPGITLALEETIDLGAQVLVWEFATAMAGRVLGINPFDQPDVEAAKAAARAVLGEGAPSEPETTSLDEVTGWVEPDDYLAICAFVDPAGDHADALAAARADLGRRLGVATTLGFGPRFLHSTGQLHKGGPADGVFLQVVETGELDVEIPAQPFTFGRLIRAQAAGDLQTLRDRGRRAARVELAELLSYC